MHATSSFRRYIYLYTFVRVRMYIVTSGFETRPQLQRNDQWLSHYPLLLLSCVSCLFYVALLVLFHDIKFACTIHREKVLESYPSFLAIEYALMVLVVTEKYRSHVSSTGDCVLHVVSLTDWLNTLIPCWIHFWTGFTPWQYFIYIFYFYFFTILYYDYFL